MLKNAIAIAGLLVAAQSFAQSVHRGKPTIQTFKNTNCAETNSCDLKEFKLHTYEYTVNIRGEMSYGSNAFISYKTKEIDQLENYAIVQKIRGCNFASRKMEDGSIEKHFLYSREFFGDIVRFKHPEWVIDSVDKDLMYNNYGPEMRHAYYRWNKKPGSYDKETEEYYFRARPERPELYASDLPGTAFVMDGLVKNISLQFETCIYKTSDVPLESTPDNINFATPIACHEWASSYIYNHNTEKFESKKEIDQFCLN
jgi:hypothetical protein